MLIKDLTPPTCSEVVNETSTLDLLIWTPIRGNPLSRMTGILFITEFYIDIVLNPISRASVTFTFLWPNEIYFTRLLTFQQSYHYTNLQDRKSKRPQFIVRKLVSWYNPILLWPLNCWYRKHKPYYNVPRKQHTNLDDLMSKLYLY